ncbi:hypothetical protein D4764_14G0009450 [Takifugu flavidus]|uniref:Uncharacterized protein n=1 Tax=Takifugu flavidus TaxID=433684 RepID=A0A5C6P5B9_9TELE|nr:hypothetical protein D4764_14G0009450 [Takifugu flavidus]
MSIFPDSEDEPEVQPVRKRSCNTPVEPNGLTFTVKISSEHILESSKPSRCIRAPVPMASVTVYTVRPVWNVRYDSSPTCKSGPQETRNCLAVRKSMVCVLRWTGDLFLGFCLLTAPLTTGLYSSAPHGSDEEYKAEMDRQKKEGEISSPVVSDLHTLPISRALVRMRPSAPEHVQQLEPT